MADKKLNEVTKVTDMAYVPVIMADGSIGQIAKADLASVVAGVMDTDKMYPFMAKGSRSISSLDSLLVSGIYSINDPSSKIGNWTAYGTMVVFNDNAKGFISHLFIHAQTLMCFRTSSNNGSTWSDWVIISIS